LREAGVVMSLRPAEGTRDRGGRAGQAPADRPSPASLAIKLATGEAKILHTFRDGAAARAGLAAGDVIVAVDGLRATPDAVERTIARRRAGERVTVHAFRRDELVAFDVTLDAAPSDTCFLTLDANAPTAAIELRRSWLGSA
jgi:predicted metalloprotease with PDZ domain